jgi:hypothetical protein
MEHPTNEELLAYLEGTDSKEATRRVSKHLKHCAQCATELAGWQRTIQMLGRRDLAQSEQFQPTFRGLVVNWAAAAAVILAIGFGLGRLSSTGHIKRAIATELRQELRADFRADLLSAVSNGPQIPSDSFQGRLRGELYTVLSELVRNTQSQEQRHFDEGLRAVQHRQDQERQRLLILLDELQQHHNADYLSLRHDLETAVSVADQDLKLNRQSLNQLAATLFATAKN